MLRRVSRESARSWFRLVLLPLVAASLGCGASSGGVGTNPIDGGRSTPEASSDGADDAGSRDDGGEASEESSGPSCLLNPASACRLEAVQTCVGNADAQLGDPSAA